MPFTASNQRASTAALKLQAWKGSGKSWRTQGMWYFAGGFFQQWVGAAAVGALHVFKLDDGHAGAGGRLERGGIVDLRSRRRRAKLGVSGDGKESGKGKGQQQAGRPVESRKATGKEERTDVTVGRPLP